MAYTPINWQTGDTITAEKLNKMDNGWGVESTQLFSETVTTADIDGDNVADLTYSQLIDADSITVTFDGTEYTCPRIIDADSGSYYYGGFSSRPDFTSYPFFIYSGDVNQLITQTAGTHTVAVAAPFLQTSADFDKARGYGYVAGSPTELFSETVTTKAIGIGMPSAALTYSQPIDANTITVMFDGTGYTCPRNDTPDAYIYGGYSEQGAVFTEYPFIISSTVDGNRVITETASTHMVSVVASVTSMQTSEDFRKAIGNPGAFEISLGVTTFAEANEAFLSGKMVYVLEATSTEAYQCQVIYVDISRHTMSALEANGVNVNLRTFSASSADGVLNS